MLYYHQLLDKGVLSMTSDPDIDKLIKQTRRYEFLDGLRDIQLAVIFGISGLAIWLAFEPFWITWIIKSMNAYGRWAGWITMLPIILLVAIFIALLPIMKFIRQHWLWRDTGIVEGSPFLVPNRINLISTFIFLISMAGSFSLKYADKVNDLFVLRMLLAATGWSFGYILAGTGRYIGLSRYIWLGLTGGLLSTILLILPLPFYQGSLVFGTGWCLLLLTSGIINFWRAATVVKPGEQ